MKQACLIHLYLLMTFTRKHRDLKGNLRLNRRKTNHILLYLFVESIFRKRHESSPH
jgi:hypothetical protein